MSIITEVIESTKAIIQGMSVTLSYLPKRKQTVQYPEEPVTVQPRYRGQHLLHVDELGREKCVACFLCAAACPSECIYIEAADDPRPAAERTGVDERYAKVYNEADDLWKQELDLDKTVDVFKTLQAKLGKIENRTLHSATEQENSGGPLKGRAFVVSYQTRFEKGEGMETFTLVLRDHEWRLARYFVNSTALK